MRREAKRPLLVGTVILVFLSIFTKSQASSKFEAVNSLWLSSCQRQVRPIFEMKWRPRAFSRVSTADSDLEVPKGSQATCSVCCGSRGGYGANAREIGLISI